MAERMAPHPGTIGLRGQAETAAASLYPAQTAFDHRREALRFLPLRWLPDRQERLEHIGPHLHTAGHEAGHLLTAMSLGYNGDVSFEPEGNSLARVTLHGSASVEDMKVIAAAGMVDTPFGQATGYGSDRFKIQAMKYLYGGRGVDESQAAAHATLSAYGPVRERFSEILAFYAANVNPTISADVIRQIYQRAAGELYQEERIPREQAEQPLPRVKPHDENIQTVIVTGERHIVVGIRTKNPDEAINSYLICPRCLGVNEHTPDCPANRIKEDKKEKLPHPLFSWEERLKELAGPAVGLIGQALRELQEKLGQHS